MLAEVGRGGGTARELTRRVYGGGIGDELMVAAEMTMRAHLQKLVDEGRARTRPSRGEEVFEPGTGSDVTSPRFSRCPPTELEAWLASRGRARRTGAARSWAGSRAGAESFADMRDVPKALRVRLEEAFRITSLTPVVTSEADSGADDQDALRAGRRSLGRGGRDALHGPLDAVHLVAGRLSDRLPLLRDGQVPVRAQPARRTRSWSRRSTPRAASRPRAGACRTSSSWAWVSRWPTTRR